MLPIDPNLVVPIIALAAKRVSPLAPDSFRFEDGNVLTVDGNIDEYSGVQGLKKITDFNGIAKITFNLAALVGAYDIQTPGASGAFFGRVCDVIKENWEEQKVPVK